MPNLKAIAEKVEQEFQCGGLSDGLYYNYAREIIGQYILEAGKQAIANSNLHYVDTTATIFFDLLEKVDDKKAKEFSEYYEVLFEI